MIRHCLTLDLKNDESLIREYEAHHKAVWPEILASIKDAGIRHMEIYRLANRLFMVMEVDANFSFEKKTEADNNNKKVQEWETIMWKYQQPIAGSVEGEKWRLMNKIFDLNEL